MDEEESGLRGGLSEEVKSLALHREHLVARLSCRRPWKLRSLYINKSVYQDYQSFQVKFYLAGMCFHEKRQIRRHT